MIDQSDSMKSYRLEIPLTISHEIGSNPEQLPAHRLLQMSAVHSLFMCSSLFWTVRHLSLIAQHDHWVYSKQELLEALEHIGELGEALASAASEHVQHLEHIAERALVAGKEGGDQ